MGARQHSDEQQVFVEGYFPSYSKHLADGTLKTDFWPTFFADWFEAWPLPEPSAEVVEKEGSLQMAKKSELAKKVAVSAVSLLTN